MSRRVIELGGKPYAIMAEGTAERDDFIYRLEGQAGLRHERRGKKEAPEAFALRLLDRLIDADVRYELLGALLVPTAVEDLDWSPALARDTGAALRRLSKPEDKRALDSQTIGVLSDFILRGIFSSSDSHIASSSEEGPENAPPRDMWETIASDAGQGSFVT